METDVSEVRVGGCVGGGGPFEASEGTRSPKKREIEVEVLFKGSRPDQQFRRQRWREGGVFVVGGCGQWTAPPPPHPPLV